jgi:hypothetical protein
LVASWARSWMDLDCAKKRGAENLLDVEAGDF